MSAGDRHPLLATWRHIMDRCYRPATSYYSSYGGRGIRVAEEWHTFQTFARDVGERPGRRYELDRIDNDGDYAPGNVRWVTKIQNAGNTRPRGGARWKGAHLDKRRNKWAAVITVDYHNFHVGYYTTEREAALAYNEIALEWFGIYSRLNSVDDVGED